MKVPDSLMTVSAHWQQKYQNLHPESMLSTAVLKITQTVLQSSMKTLRNWKKGQVPWNQELIPWAQVWQHWQMELLSILTVQILSQTELPLM